MLGERAAIEKDYSSRLKALANKHFEKKAKRSSSLSVGDTPTLTPGSLESASITTWTTLLSVLETKAAEHDRYSSELVSQVADPLKFLAERYEELRKSHAEYAAKLEKERDVSYGELKKTKGRYDGACQEVENKRKKSDSSKSQSAYQQQLMEMHNVKNTYIIAMKVTNKQKEHYYHVDVPDVLDSLQDLSETRIKQTNKLWLHAVQLEKSSLSRNMDQLSHLASEIPRNDPNLDSAMFMKHNVPQWQEPFDMAFEPSPVWLDDSSMVTDETAKIFLRNVLSRSKAQLRELKQEVDKKKREVDGVKRIRQNVKEGKDKRDEVETVRGLFSMQQDLHDVDRRRLAAEVETQAIISVVGDLSVGAQNHQFKSQTFKVPTNCDLCGERIWGLSAKGFDCKDCGYTCHSKCELKVPAECPGEQSKEERKRLKVERQAASKAAPAHINGGSQDGTNEHTSMTRTTTMDTLSSGYAASANRSVSGRSIPDEPQADGASPSPTPKPAPRRNRIVAPPPTSYLSEQSSKVPSGRSGASRVSDPRGKMRYPYQASGDGEVTVDEGDEVTIFEPDDGSGWTSVRLNSQSTGLVPTSYIEFLPNNPSVPERPISTYSSSSASVASSVPSKKKGPAVAPKRGAKKLTYAEALYDYEARSDMEWSINEGERFVLVNRDTGDGWADVEKGGVTKSVPANYIQEV